ncbi:GyrI-like domain-containing protein [Halobacillus shinanisalinarum]|uniref:GyrI-like domain-containing protein n=1 Tax=Halobacillus shinanisalinarum TaxID=2932258 RepID=A0ABY4GWD4_9BACI|nr:GyrI-like domain-containing protein [Halobacillus shinanisalinarum]UOQ92438.1 GyrI-like domain-containing protein [Halobacillus shinanisalinarum]
MKHTIVERDAFQVAGIKKEISCDNEDKDIQLLWGEATKSGIADLLVQLNNGQINGLLAIYDNYNETQNTWDYWIATQFHGNVPDELSSFEVPPSRWVVFEVHGLIPEAIENVWKQIDSGWLPSNGYETADIASLEVYKEFYPYHSDSYSEIWVPIR